MREIANLELFCICKELQILVGARLTKIYEVGNDEFRLRFHSPQCGDVDVFCKLKERINITQYIKEAPQKPSNFVMALRKYVEGARVKSIMQYGLDRVLVFELEKAERFLLIFEMFSHGNLILTDCNYKVLHPYRSEEWKDREVRRGSKYDFPKSERADPFQLNEPKLMGLLGPMKIVPCLSSKINLGPAYIEEACRRAKLDLERNANSLSESEVAELFAGFIEVVEYVNKPEPTIYIKDGKYIDYSILPMKKYEGLETIQIKSLSALLDEFYMHFSGEEKKPNEKRVKIEMKIKEQEKALNEFREMAKESKESGDAIYANFDKVEAILRFINERRKMPSDKIMSELKEKMPEESKLVENLDLKKGEIILNL
ncbi:MAG: NFACT family protein [Candidatus Micrarchaeota archaeon]|nr:NFACT family protein [Candidatus Micrarchaeota archaeon]